jgi:hypothetical protein
VERLTSIFRVETQQNDYAQPPAARWFLALLIFGPDDGSNTFLRNVGSHRTTRRYIPEDSNIQVKQL